MAEPTAPKTSPRRGWPRLLRRWLVVLLVAYLAVSILLLVIQEWLIFPGRVSQGRPDATIQPSAPRGEELLDATTSRGDRVVALFCPATDPLGRPLQARREQPVVLLFHGNGESVANVAPLARGLASLGLNVVVPEYPGFGMASGRPGEQAIYAAVDAMLDRLRTREDLDLSRLVPVGWSLGAAVAIDTASRHPVRGVVALSPFTSIPAVARRTFWFLPVRWLVRHRFDNLSKIPALRVPIFLSHGRHDGIVPFDMSETLAAAATAPVTTRWLDADHNDLLSVGGERLLREIADFVIRSAGSAPGTRPKE